MLKVIQEYRKSLFPLESWEKKHSCYRKILIGIPMLDSYFHRHTHTGRDSIYPLPPSGTHLHSPPSTMKGNMGGFIPHTFDLLLNGLEKKGATAFISLVLAPRSLNFGHVIKVTFLAPSRHGLQRDPCFYRVSLPLKLKLTTPESLPTPFCDVDEWVMEYELVIHNTGWLC